MEMRLMNVNSDNFEYQNQSKIRSKSNLKKDKFKSRSWCQCRWEHVCCLILLCVITCGTFGCGLYLLIEFFTILMKFNQNYSQLTTPTIIFTISSTTIKVPHSSTFPSFSTYSTSSENSSSIKLNSTES
jgi:hypothetical protein